VRTFYGGKLIVSSEKSRSITKLRTIILQNRCADFVNRGYGD